MENQTGTLPIQHHRAQSSPYFGEDMAQRTHARPHYKFFLTIIFPTLLAILLSVGSIYAVILPAFQHTFLESKKEMIQQLTNVSWNILVYYEKLHQQGRLGREEAQERAKDEIRHLRYGSQNMDYFFIVDMNLRMIMHPYSTELEQQSLADYRDPDGKPLFVEMLKMAELEDSGYINYTWQTKYDSDGIVAKLSYVKKFAPWGWIVGTGVFLDDVEQKTAEITTRLLKMVYLGLAFFAVLLSFIALQSFRIERKRRSVEERLRLSRQKYKALAESTTAPTVMIYDGTIIYANKSICTLLGFSMETLMSMEPQQLFPQSMDEIESGLEYFREALSGKQPGDSLEGTLQGINGSLISVEISFSQIALGDQKATILITRDTRTSSETFISQEAEDSFQLKMLENLEVGVFTSGAEVNLPLLEASNITRQLLKLPPDKDIQDVYLMDYLTDVNERNELQSRLKKAEIIRDRTVQIRHKKGERSQIFSLALVPRRNKLNEVQYYDGLIADITEKVRTEMERENLIVELQTSLLFLNQPIKYSLKNFVSCHLHTSIAQSARIMAKAKLSSILVQSDSGVMVGIITDMVLRERVIAESLPFDTPVYQVMSSPLIFIDESALIFEAVLLMQERGIKHLVVKDSKGEVVSVISNEELLHVQRYSTAFMLSQIREADSFEQILDSRDRIPRVVKSLTDSGAHAKSITRIITTVSDTILTKIIDLVIQELGEPPRRFGFISLGSEGRGEQTLVTDQDNALIIEDVPENDWQAVQKYFLRFGKRVCTYLDTAGYQFCTGEIMAMNPKWCQPVSAWKNYFTKWVKEGSPQDLLEASIFFDFRCVYGDDRFAGELRKHLKSLVKDRATFLQHLAQTALSFKAPLDFFGNIHAEGSQQKNSFDIKKVISCIVGFARLYSVENGLESTNTIQRLSELYAQGIINRATWEELSEAYDHLMKLRFRHQVGSIDAGQAPDNHIRIDDLSHMDRIMLKKAFSQVTSAQKRLSYDFSGIA